MAQAQDTLTIELKPAGDTAEVIIRHGEAPANPALPRKLEYGGRLYTPRQFLSKKLDLYGARECTFVVDKQADRVTFYGQEKETPADVITGALTLNPDLLAFQLNGEKRWGTKELWSFLKVRAYFFADALEHAAFVRGLADFSSRVQTAVVSKHDNEGNKMDLIERVVQENSLSGGAGFRLKLPIFQGYQDLVFRVDLGFEPTSTGVSIFLYSDELLALLYQERERLMGEEAAYFDAWGCAVLTKS